MLSCTIANSKPAAEIKWYRGHVELKMSDNRHDVVIPLDNKRFTVSSNLTLKASANDDLVDYTCRGKHQALSPDHPMKSSVQVSVLKAPGEPFIEGYSKGERLRSGQEVELVCRSYGGNPPAQLIWYKNNRQVVSQYTTSGRDSASTYRFKVQSGDNKARLRCEASNTISDKALKKELDLTVLCEYHFQSFNSSSIHPFRLSLEADENDTRNSAIQIFLFFTQLSSAGKSFPMQFAKSFSWKTFWHLPSLLSINRRVKKFFFIILLQKCLIDVYSNSI